MSPESQQPQAPTRHFDAAKDIVETLQGLDKTAQMLAMRFAAETLGLRPAPEIQIPAAPASVSLTSGSLPAGGGPTHSTDIRQFTAAKAPKSDQQFAAVVAYFYRFEAPEAERSETIDSKTLLAAARQAGRKRPGNARVTLNNAKNAGYLDAAGTGKFRINSVGENLVAIGLPGGASEGSLERTVMKKKARKKKTDNTNQSSADTQKSRRRR
jgi:hypothetical protein